jgi:hypothetical protein
MKSPKDDLDALLDTWTPPAPPPSLEREVWNRIERDDRRHGGSWFLSWDTLLSRPPIAALFVACCVLGGLFFAEWRVARAQEERNARLAESYLKLIAPLVAEAAPATKEGRP